MKKIVAILLLVLCLGSFVGCGNLNNENDSTEKSFDLTLENYTYYLTLDTEITGSGSYLLGHHWCSKKLTVYGAVSGLYVDCVLYYKIGEVEEKSFKLNATGFGTINYNETTDSGRFSITQVSGKIVI